MQRKIKFGVVGYGHIGKRHAAMIQRHEECELQALCDVKPPAELGLQPNDDTPFYNSLEYLLASEPDIDVLCICTPNGLHTSQSILGLEAGKHIVCEKPMGLTKASCEQVIHASLNQSRHFFCVMQNRYSPASQWIKSVMTDQLLGEIYLVQINCYWNRDDRYYLPGGQAHDWHGHPELDGGTLYTQFSHFIDLMYWLFGDITDIRTRLMDFNHRHSTGFEDSGMAQFRFVNGGMGCIQFSTSVWDKNFESSVTIIGQNGTVKLGGQYMNEVTFCHIKNYEMPDLPEAAPANDYGGYQGSAANHHFVIQNVVDVLRGRRQATTNALEGMKVVDIIQRIYEAGRGRKKSAAHHPFNQSYFI